MRAKFWLKFGIPLAIALAAIATLVGLGVPARAATLTVCLSGCNFNTIQAAVTSALADGNTSDTISVAAGNYPEVVTINGSSLTNDKAIVINGAGEGGATACNATVDTCVGGSVQNGPVFTVTTGSHLSATLQNLTVQNGHSPDTTTIVGGMSLNSSSGRVSIDNVAVINNTGCETGGVETGPDGSGIFLNNAIISGNTGTDCGTGFGGSAGVVGGFYGDPGRLTNVTISNNRSTPLGCSGVGGIELRADQGFASQLSDAVVSNNTVAITGCLGSTLEATGGVASSGFAELTDVLISGNSASSAEGPTICEVIGGIAGAGSAGSLPSLTNVTISGNSASVAAGVRCDATGGASGGSDVLTALLTNVTVSGNTATGSGFVTSCCGNDLGAVGGLAAAPGTSNVGFGIFSGTNLTVAGNRATNNGFAPGPTATPFPAKSGGMGGFGGNIQGSILSGNTADGNAGNCAGTLTSQGFNISDDTTCSTSFTATGDLNGNSSLNLASLAGNGGLVVGAAGDTSVLSTQALGSGSSAIDHIPTSAPCPGNNNSSPMAYPGVDERNISRPQGTACDSGALEVQVASTPTSVSNVTVSPSPNTPGASSTYTITFKATSTLGPGGTITIVAPDGTIFPDPDAALYGITIPQCSGCSLSNLAVTNQVNGTGGYRQVVLTLPSFSISAGETVTLTIQGGNNSLLQPGVINPAAGSCTLTLATSSDTVPATSPPYQIGTGGTGACNAGATPTPTATATSTAVSGGSGGSGFIIQPTPVRTATSTATSTAPATATPTGGTGTTPTPASGPTNFTVGATLPAGSSIDCSGNTCIVHIPAVQGAGAYTVTAGSGVTLNCPTNPAVTPPETCTASSGGATLTFTNVPAGGVLSFGATGLSGQTSGLASKARGLLAWLVGDNAASPADAASSVGSFSVTGPGGALASNAPLPAGLSLSVAAGWNLVGAPNGSQLGGTAGALYTFQASDSAYESFPTTVSLSGGVGVWAFFPQAGLVTGLPVVTAQTLHLTLPAGHFIMAGNPTDGPVSLSGADVVDTFNTATNQYSVATGTVTLAPGQGAWVFSRFGGTLTITPSGS